MKYELIVRENLGTTQGMFSRLDRGWIDLRATDDDGSTLYYPDMVRPAVWRVCFEYVEGDEQDKAKQISRALSELSKMFKFSYEGKFWKLLKPKKGNQRKEASE